MKFRNLHVCDHPLIQDRVGRLRDRRTKFSDFRRFVAEVSVMMGYEILRDVSTERIRVKTPLGTATCGVVRTPVVFVSVLRAGLGMIDGLLKIVPEAATGHIGIYRNEETLEPVRYYSRLPGNLHKSRVILADPMIATGGSAIEAIDILKSKKARGIRLMSIISAKPGLERLWKSHPDVHVFTASVDETLTGNGYIFPGLGDAGDRIFGTC